MAAMELSISSDNSAQYENDPYPRWYTSVRLLLLSGCDSLACCVVLIRTTQIGVSICIANDDLMMTSENS